MSRPLGFCLQSGIAWIVAVTILFGAGAGIAVITALLGRGLDTGAITTPELGPHASVGSAVSAGAAIGGALVAETLIGLVLLAFDSPSVFVTYRAVPPPPRWPSP